ncbi:MAG: tetratricopeptide repeat protein [Nitrospinae bacterium]|nr:tetratricopeptide repeat protein [Nitrospinota bacterium]
MRLILISAIFLIGSPAGFFAQETGTGYDSAGNYIEDFVIDDKQNRKLAIQRLEKKQKEYIERIKKDPQNHLYQYYLGKIYLELNRPEKAIAVFTETVKLNPRNGKAHYQLAKAYDRVKDTSQAIKHIQIASQIFEDDFDLHWQTKIKAFLLQLRDQE